MTESIIHYIRAGYPGIYIVSSEEVRVEAEIKTMADSLAHRLYAWSVSEGMTDTSDGNVQDAPDPMAALSLIPDLPENTLVLLRDFHLFLENPDPFLTRAFKDILRHSKSKAKTVIMLGCRKVLPMELLAPLHRGQDTRSFLRNDLQKKQVRIHRVLIGTIGSAH